MQPGCKVSGFFLNSKWREKDSSVSGEAFYKININIDALSLLIQFLVLTEEKALNNAGYAAKFHSQMLRYFAFVVL